MRQFLVALTLLALFLMPMMWAEAHDGMNDEWYDSLKVPGTEMLCCNMRDCKEVVARIEKDHWQVYIDSKTFPDSETWPEGHAPNDWVDVPDNVILKGKDNPTGAPIACWYARVVRCFIPAAEI